MKPRLHLSFAVLALSMALSTAGQGPLNMTCSYAIPFCDDLVFAYGGSTTMVQESGCYWFTFRVEETGPVDLNVQMADDSGRFLLVGPDPGCDGSGTFDCEIDFGGADHLQIDQVLDAGDYFIVAQLEQGDEWPLEIEVNVGLGCGELPDNTTCDEAIPFCGDMVLEVSADPTGADCFWFSFTVAETQDITFSVSCQGASIGMATCPYSGDCDGGVPPGSTFTYEEEGVPPGTYFVRVERTYAFAGPIVIDVLEGLGCPQLPSNTECGGAIFFCADMVQEIQPEWTAENSLDEVGCLWYMFSLDQPQEVQLSVSSTGSVIALYGPFTSIEGCDDGFETPCTHTVVPEMQASDLLEVDGELLAGSYFIQVGLGTNPSGPVEIDVVSGLACLPCEGCLPPFSLLPGKAYVVSAWTRVLGLPATTITYETPRIRVESPVGTEIGEFSPAGVIIDGWQRIEGVFTTPGTITGLKIELTVATSSTAYFDDVRVFPAEGSMKSYVYDPENLRFVAELDERHYATFYEYDSEGKLTRVKKETERGIMTIQETRYNSSKLSTQ